MRKKWHWLPLSLVLLTGFTITVKASTPYRSYNETQWSTEAAAPDSYEPVEQYSGAMIGTKSLYEPADLCFDDAGNLYIADTKNNRIVITDSKMTFKREITDITVDGNAESLNEPRGIYVHKGFIYIADTENNRALKMTKDGVVVCQYLRPSDSAYTAEMYRPIKIIVDKDDSVFLLSEGVFQGVLFYDNSGNFKSFFGSARVQPSFKLLADRMWKKLLSKKQSSKMSNYVPVEYENIETDKNGFIYACCLYTDNNSEQIRKLNYLGNNIYPYIGNFGETDVVYYKRNFIRTTFVDISVDEDNILFGLDSTRGRIYGYDRDGNRLFIFGAAGEMKGTFKSASAIETYNGLVYVLDSATNTITSFKPTHYGSQIRKAVLLYTKGEYKQAQALWEEILKLNCNLELAYDGMGEAMLKSGDYKQAMEYFKTGGNKERESVAFQKYRGQLLRENTIPVALTILVLLIAVLVFARKSFWHKLAIKRSKHSSKKGRLREEFSIVLQVLAHPINTLSELKYKRYRNWYLVIFVLIWWFLQQVLSRQIYGFRFTKYDADTLNIIAELFLTVIPFTLFCLANWASCSILDGEGKFNEISTFTSLAMVPYLLFQTAGIGLSNILTLTEGDFLNWFLLIGTLWSVFLLFQAVRIVHQYSVVKTVVVILLSLLGMVLILFILLLLFSLFQQMYSFVKTLTSEIMYSK